MKLREKILLGMAVLTVIFVLIISFVSFAVVGNSFARLEEGLCRRNVARARAAIDEQLRALCATTRDWANWDDTYRYVSDRNPEYEKTNLTGQGLGVVACDYLLFFDDAGRLVKSVGYDRQAEVERPVPAAIMVQMTSNFPPVRVCAGGIDEVSGLLTTDDGPFLMCSRPILNSQGEGPVRGALIMLRQLGEREIERLGKTVQLNLHLDSVHDEDIRPEILTSVLAQPDSVIVKAMSPARIEGFMAMQEFQNTPRLILHVEMPRDITQEGRKAGRLFLLLLVLAVVSFSGVGLWVLGRQVLGPLTRLEEGIDAVGASGNLAARVPVEGDDELAHLARCVNGLLEKIQHSQLDLRDGEARYRRLADCLRGEYFLYSLDPNSRFSYVSPSIRDVLGYSPEEFLSRYTDYLTDHPANENARRCTLLNLSGQAQPLHEMEVFHKDGSRHWIESLGHPVLDASGKVIAVDGIAHDVTTRKREQDERKAMRSELSQRQKLEAVGVLARGVAHEINNPINGIMNYAQLIVDQSSPNEGSRGHATEIIRECERVVQIVQKLLAFATHDETSMKPARVADLVAAVTSLISASLREDHIAMEVDVPERLPRVSCRASQIQQVVMALMSNAREALNEKYPGEEPDKTIHLFAHGVPEEEPRWVRITVEDHGPGISPPVKARLFEPFFTTKSRAEHGGLGLPLCYRIISQHGGRLECETLPGRFTRFHVDLPINA